MKNERETKDIGKIEDDLAGDILKQPEDIPGVILTTNPWDSEEVKNDVYDRRDSEVTRNIFTLTIPNNQYLENGQENPGYHKLCIGRDYSQFQPEDSIECVVLKRVRPNIESVPYNESRGLEPWERTVGYSLDGIRPTPNAKGEYFQSCIDPFTSKPYAMCSQATEFNKRERVVKSLDTDTSVITNKDYSYLPKETKIECCGECPRARWGNTMTAEDRKKYGIRSVETKPSCDEHILMYCWHLTRKLLFVVYYKRASLSKADSFLAGFKRSSGPTGKKGIPLYRYISLLSVEVVSAYVIPVITNTGKESDYSVMKPVVEWFEERESEFIRNQALVLQEMKEKSDKDTEFPAEQS